MTDSEKIQAIDKILKEYVDDEDHWTVYFIEKICDIVWERNKNE